MEERQELVYFDRYAGQLRSEAVYGESALRWAYETRLGRLCLESVIRRRWFSSLYGRWADCGCSAREVPSFIQRFELDPDEFLDPPDSFASFNDFFSRRLKPDARPITSGESEICFPADGRHLLVPDLGRESTLYAKGQLLSIDALLDDAELAETFSGGTAILSRLCPTDYHRFHFPLSGHPETPRMINGVLYSVNPVALARSLSYLWQNKRRLTEVRDSSAGTYLFLEVGATNVGTIRDTCDYSGPVKKGDEKGYFRFGGSMVITLFRKGTFRPADDLAAQSERGIELYARFGDRMGSVIETPAT